MINKSILENGIRVITESMSGVRSVALGILVDAGPTHESSNNYGLAHLVEHMMFQGTSSRDAGEIARMMDAGGGQMGAFTTRDYTCYYSTVLDEYATYALELLGDMLLNSIFPTHSLEMEKTAIVNEINAEVDSPEHRAHSLLKAGAWPDHTLGRPITGQVDTVRNFTREDVIYFCHEHYSPNRLIITAAGSVRHEDFTAQVRDAFWRLSGHSNPAPLREAAYHSCVRVEHMPVSQTYFAIGLPAYSYTHDNRYALHVFNNILGGGMSSRLFRGLREERGMVYCIDSQYHAYREGGMLVIEGATLPQNFMQVLSAILYELYLLIVGEKSVNADELWKAQMHIRGQHLISSEDTNTRMSRLATQEFYFGKQISAEEILSEIDKVDLKRIGETVSELLYDFISKITIAVVGPEATDHYSKHSIEELLAGLR